ncbi:MAG: amidohydrolase, partial [Bacteroidota bacterium]
MKALKITFLLFVLALIVSACGGSGEKENKEVADMILTNGKINTMAEGQGVQEAIAIKDGLVLATGTSEEIKNLADENT